MRLSWKKALLINKACIELISDFCYYFLREINANKNYPPRLKKVFKHQPGICLLFCFLILFKPDNKEVITATVVTSVVVYVDHCWLHWRHDGLQSNCEEKKKIQ